MAITDLLKGQTAIVTGAARGIGRGIATLFLAQGACVVTADIDAIADFDGADGRVLKVAADVSRDGDVAATVRAAVDHFGGLDCIVNNAARPGPIEGIADLAAEAFEATIALVLGSVYSGIRHAVPVMRAQGRGGSIVNIGSTSALVASSVLQPYGAAKAGVSMLTRSTAVELAADRIRVNCLCPGGIATALYGLSAGLDPEAAASRIDVVAGNLAAQLPLGRAGTPEDVAHAALFLASSLSTFVTGQIIAVDGGMTAGRPMPPGVTPDRFFGRVAGIDPQS
ncbi:SDR family oxidoreductase [Sphingomonas naphthae]|uniref:SDR family oxidoreductase n=1 Tax=Sphingomonas naphthae TaxID=1813468 RepID=A0ABY7TQN7_9SPHN|nr:SDR family oxidoreductase [Sphingomonas naphthae]WCT74489.1 SDR family oxidoreductase [Sphingomonas naphthae]